LKRAPFVGAAAAVLLAGCGGRHVLQALPGVASSTAKTSRPQAGTLVPASADPIPANVLAHPIIGEGWRFDGPVAPPGWALAQGQTLKVAESPKLFAILGTIAGGDGRTSFRLPSPGFGYVIAVAGIFPTSPEALVQSGRRKTSHQDSLGPGAVASVRVPKAKPERTRAMAEAQRLQSSSIHVGPAVFQPVSAEMRARFTESRFATRDVALASLSSANRGVLEAMLERAASGASSLNDAVVRMTPLLSGAESAALLEVSDNRLRAFRTQWYGAAHANPQLEAARFAVSIGFSPEQLRRYIALQD
jgi:Phage Tail Collar Domain